MDFCAAVLEDRQPEMGKLGLALHVMQVYEAGLISAGTPVAIEEVKVHATA